MFWMAFDDFRSTFTRVDVCDRSTGLHDLRLNVDADAGPCGACAGCVRGCASFWCLCRGCRALYCAHLSSAATRAVPSGCLSACARGCAACGRELCAAAVTLSRCCSSAARRANGRAELI
jgi:hypothetical protein